jgi:hypothetical protein
MTEAWLVWGKRKGYLTASVQKFPEASQA